MVEPFLALALRAAELWSPRRSRSRTSSARLADVGRGAGRRPGAPGAGAAHPGRLRPTREEHLALLDEAAATDDVDLAWRVLVRRAALGRLRPDAAVEALLERDPDPDACGPGAGGVTAARPTRSQGRGLGRALRAPLGARRAARLLERGPALLAPGPARAAAAVGAPLPRRGRPRLAGGGMLAVGSLMRAMFPTSRRRGVPRAGPRVAAGPDQNPTVRATLLGGADTLDRMLRARG